MILAGNLVITESLINAYRLVHKLCTYAKLLARYKTFISLIIVSRSHSKLHTDYRVTNQSKTQKVTTTFHIQEESSLDDANDVMHSWNA